MACAADALLLIAILAALVVMMMGVGKTAAEAYTPLKPSKKCKGVKATPRCYLSKDPDKCCKKRDGECDPDQDCRNGKFAPSCDKKVRVSCKNYSDPEACCKSEDTLRCARNDAYCERLRLGFDDDVKTTPSPSPFPEECGKGMRGVPPCYLSDDKDKCCKNRNLKCDPDADCSNGKFSPICSRMARRPCEQERDPVACCNSPDTKRCGGSDEFCKGLRLGAVTPSPSPEVVVSRKCPKNRPKAPRCMEEDDADKCCRRRDHRCDPDPDCRQDPDTKEWSFRILCNKKAREQCERSDNPLECCKGKDLKRCDRADNFCKGLLFGTTPTPKTPKPTVRPANRRTPTPMNTTSGDDLIARYTPPPDLYKTMQEQSKAAKEHRRLLKRAIEGGESNEARQIKLYIAKVTLARTHAQSSVPFAVSIATSVKSSTQAREAAKTALSWFDTLVVLEIEAKKERMMLPYDVTKAELFANDAERARIMCQDALLSAMADTDPVRPVKLPPRPVPVEDCEAYSKADGVQIGDETRQLRPEQTRLIAYLQAKGQELLAHMLKKYPNDPLTKNLNTHWSRRVLPRSQEGEAVKDAWMSTAGVRFSRCIFVNMTLTGSVPRSLTRLVHELAHIAADSDGMESHTARFYTTERRMLRIATDELNWTVENWCREACDLAKDSVSIDPKKACPKCIWQRAPELCVKDLEADSRMCRPNDEEDTGGVSEPAPTRQNVPLLRTTAAEAARQASKLLMEIDMTSFASASAKAKAQAQATRSINAHKRLKAAKDASPEMAMALSAISTAANAAAKDMLKKVASAPLPVFTV